MTNSGSRFQVPGFRKKVPQDRISPAPGPWPLEPGTRGFTLIETLVAISLLMIAIVAPMTLTEQSLQSAYYAHDQITAYYLAQEAVEAVRSVRDNNILYIAENASNPPCTPMTIFCDIPIGTQSAPVPFRIDATQTNSSNAITTCNNDPGGVCEPIEIDGTDTLYGYGAGWTPTNFTRTVEATVVMSDQNGVPQEIRVTVTVSWKTGAYASRSFSISENMYRWIDDGSGA